jgi:hypothetical protein
LGSNRISPDGKTKGDFSKITFGLSLFIGVFLDISEQLSRNTQIANRNERGILSYARNIAGEPEFILHELLGYLDALDECLIANISAADGFKGSSVLKGLRIVPCHASILPFRRLVVSVFTSYQDVDDGEKSAWVLFVKHAHQLFTFLKKLSVDRPDLASDMAVEFFEFEEHLGSLAEYQEMSDEYKDIVAEMHTILKSHLNHFDDTTLKPKHGPGVVADPTVQSWLEKARSGKQDRRIDYMLSRAGLGKSENYLPLQNGGHSDRTSRYITVPKTWKKLRGISAEPVELQFWQQAVMQRIDMMFCRDPWWQRRVNLHSQDRSRSLALASSVTGDYATIDLSAASDSVSSKLVRDVFKGTRLGLWLQSTRSIHTLCGDKIVKTKKFAPMGSACCFPVECMIFTLAAEVACSRASSSSHNVREVIVYGDDIIIPTYAVDELLGILSVLGFSINVEKSYWRGQFREACGVEAWAGNDIASCKYKSYNEPISAPVVGHDDFASLLSLANEMFKRGLVIARKWVLDFLLSKKVKTFKKPFHTMTTDVAMIAAFDDVRGTLISPNPSNFHLSTKVDSDLQAIAYRVMVWRRELRPVSPVDQSDLQISLYTDWLITHQYDVADDLADGVDRLHGSGPNPFNIRENIEMDPRSRMRNDNKMVPKFKWVVL